MHALADFVKEYTSTTGTGLSLTLSGAVPGCARFSDCSNITNNTTVYYLIKNGSNYEQGVGTWKTGNLLERTTPEVTFVAGTLDDTSPTKINLVGQSEVMIATTSKVFSDIFDNPNPFASLTVTGDIAVSKTVTAPATTGAQTINKTAGAVNFAAAAASLVVTNSLVTANSIVLATVATNDATMISVQAIAGSGSFTLYANAAATAETRVNFIVVN